MPITDQPLPSASSALSPPLVTIIILTRDGATNLDQLFASIAKVNSYKTIEIIVIDHNSAISVEGVVQRWSPTFSINLIRLKDNCSFSWSNNRAVEISKGEIVLFLNDDIIIESDIIGPCVATLDDPKVGIVGVRLDDVSRNVNRIQHIGTRFASFDLAHKMIRPANFVDEDIDHRIVETTVELPAVTAAAMFVRRKEFMEVGGFCQSYIYGYEDVDLCLKYRQQLKKKVICRNDLICLHAEGSTRSKVTRAYSDVTRKNNKKHLWRRFGSAIKRDYQLGLVACDPIWVGRRMTVNFAVSDISENPASDGFAGDYADDYNAARELGRSLSAQFGWTINFLPADKWYDQSDADITVATLDRFDPRKIESRKPGSLVAAWVRDRVDKWHRRAGFSDFDLYLCASENAAQFVRKVGVPCSLLLNATRLAPMSLAPKVRANTRPFDYVFVGDYKGRTREVVRLLHPQSINAKGAIFGINWEKHQPTPEIWQGHKPYEDLPALYRSSKILIDDADHPTKPWGCINEAVFDAIASGCLVITNNKHIDVAAFDGLLPTYETEDKLKDLIEFYSNNDRARDGLVSRLQAIVQNRHSYDHRAQHFRAILTDFAKSKFRISIKVPAPTRRGAHGWGDFHFAQGLSQALRKQGHSVRIDVRAEWYRPESLADDAAIVLQGLGEYEPQDGQINIMWLISHPEKVRLEQYDKYDHIFCASRKYTQTLKKKIQTPVECLLQCADISRFGRDMDAEAGVKSEVLFVGNTRQEYRKSVRWAVDQNIPLTVFGRDWSDFIDAEFIGGAYIPNEDLWAHYRSAKIVLNDHWDTMAENGFISNRIFDVAAAGGFVISDEVDGLSEVFGDLVPTYRDAETLSAVVEKYLGDPEGRSRISNAVVAIVREHHTFGRRAEQISTTVADLISKTTAAHISQPMSPSLSKTIPAPSVKVPSEGNNFGHAEPKFIPDWNEKITK